MSELTDDILEKAITGKVSTNSDLSPREETVPVRQDRFPTGKRRFLFGAPGSLRFVGNILVGGVNAPALRSVAAPDSHPRRSQRLVQEHLFYGADIVSEGTGGNTTVGSPNLFDTGGVNVQLAVTNTGYTATDLLLVFRNPLTTQAGIFTVTGVSGDIIGVDNAENLPTLGEQEWALIKPNPVELLPYNDEEGGEPTAYFAIKPPKWPTREVAVAGISVTSYLVSQERVTLVVEHSQSGQVFFAGDFLSEQSGSTYVSEGAPTFVVVGSTFSAGSPNTETITATPFYNTDISRLDLRNTVVKVKTVEDFLPYEALASTYVGSFSNFSEAPFDAVRVRNIVSPNDVDVAFRTPSGAMFSPQVGGEGGLSQPGYQLTLFPATGTGQPDLSQPITNLEKVGVIVDYENGVVRLSAPATSGGPLNPNSYTDADGRAKLFATFIAENDTISPVAAQELTHRLQTDFELQPGMNRASLRFSEGQQESDDYGKGHNTPSEREKGWVFGFPASEVAELYHRDPDGDVKGGKEEQIAVTGTLSDASQRGINTYYQYRSDLSGFFRLGGMFYGIGTDERTSRFVFRPDANGLVNYDADRVMEEFGSEDQPEFRITYDQVFADTDVEGSFASVSASTDTLRFVINDIPVTLTLTNGVTPSAASLQSDIDAAITAAATALGVATGTYAVTVENDGGGNYVRILADSNLYFHDGNGHANVGLPTDTYVRSEGLRLQFGWNNTVINEISWDKDDQNFIWDGNDIQLSSGVSLLSHETDLTNHETRLDRLDTGYTTLPALINNVATGELAYLNSYEGTDLLTTEMTSPAATTSFGVCATDGLNVYVADGASIDVYETVNLTFVRTIATGLTAPIDRIVTNGSEILVAKNGTSAAPSRFEAYSVTGGASLWTAALDPSPGVASTSQIALDDDQAYYAAGVPSGGGGGFALEAVNASTGTGVWTYAGASVNAGIGGLFSDNEALYLAEGDAGAQIVRLNRTTGAEVNVGSLASNVTNGFVVDGKLAYQLSGGTGITAYVKGDVSFTGTTTTTPFGNYSFGCQDERHIYFVDTTATDIVGIYDKASRLPAGHRDDLGTITGICTDGWRLYVSNGSNVRALNTGREAKVWKRISGGHWLKQFAIPGSN